MLRTDARHFTGLALDEADYTTAYEVVELLLRHPILMRLPFVVGDGRAVVANPPERVLELLD